MKIYVSGPMRGIAEFNFPQFDNLAAFLRLEANEVFNPAEHDRDVYPDITEWPGYAAGDDKLCPKFDYATSMTWDISTILRCDAIVMLPNWWHSTGAKFERFVAEQLNKLVYVAMPVMAGDAQLSWHVFPDTVKRLAGPTATSVEVHHE